MKNAPSDETDDPLSRVLQGWKVTTPLPPRFQEQVWQRIARAEAPAKSSLWSELLRWLEGAVPRPAMAVSYLAVLLATGVMTGYWRGQEKTAHVWQQLGSRYIQSVDPYQAVASRK